LKGHAMSTRDFMLRGINLRGLFVMDAGTGAANTTLWLAKKLKEAGGGRRWQTYKSVAELVDGEHYTETYPEELEFAAKIVGFKDIELKKFGGGPLSTKAMNEWREVMPEMINKIVDEDLKVAFQKATERIWKTYKEQGGIFPQVYVMRMKK